MILATLEKGICRNVQFHRHDDEYVYAHVQHVHDGARKFNGTDRFSSGLISNF